MEITASDVVGEPSILALICARDVTIAYMLMMDGEIHSYFSGGREPPSGSFLDKDKEIIDER